MEQPSLLIASEYLQTGNRYITRQSCVPTVYTLTTTLALLHKELVVTFIPNYNMYMYMYKQ